LTERKQTKSPYIVYPDFRVARNDTKMLKKRTRGRPRKHADNAAKCRAYRQRLKRSMHFRSESHVWSTPQDTFDALDAEFHFTVDVCALPENAKCARYYSPEHNGLVQDWSGEVVWCNPPYGRAIAAWVQKAYEASKASAIVVCLFPSRTGPRWWQAFVLPYAEIRYLNKRLKFVGAPRNAPFDSAVAIYRPVSQ
jgi:phage N-6-adenine-methyltransferase